jgi:hypothetical protein
MLPKDVFTGSFTSARQRKVSIRAIRNDMAALLFSGTAWVYA